MADQTYQTSDSDISASRILPTVSTNNKQPDQSFKKKKEKQGRKCDNSNLAGSVYVTGLIKSVPDEM